MKLKQCVALGLALVLASQASWAATSLWQVSKNKRVFYLGPALAP